MCLKDYRIFCERDKFRLIPKREHYFFDDKNAHYFGCKEGFIIKWLWFWVHIQAPSGELDTRGKKDNDK